MFTRSLDASCYLFNSVYQKKKKNYNFNTFSGGLSSVQFDFQVVFVVHITLQTNPV